MNVLRTSVFGPPGPTPFVLGTVESVAPAAPEFNGSWQNLVGVSGSIPGFTAVGPGGTWGTPPSAFTYSANGGVLDIPDNDGSDFGFSSGLLGGLITSGGEALVAYKMSAANPGGAQAIGLFVERLDDADQSGNNQTRSVFSTVISNSSVNGIYNIGWWDVEIEEGSPNQFIAAAPAAASNVYQGNTLYYLRVQWTPAQSRWKSKLWRAVDNEPASWQLNEVIIGLNVGQGATAGIMADGNPTGVSNTVYFKWIAYAATGTVDNPDTFTGTLPTSWTP